MSNESRRSSTSHKHWKLNWWDLWPLVDGERRPIQWASSSLILSPHPSSPEVVARPFPFSSSFLLPSPTPVLNNPNAFSSPSVIEVSPGDDYIFAFFEGKGGDNAACIWHREDAMDTWRVNIFWQIKPGQGIVLARWLGDERLWIHDSPPIRAPPLGPVNPFGKTTLLLVNQSYVVQIVQRTSPSFPFQLVSASLRHTSQANLVDRISPGDLSNGPGGLSVCVKAAVGLGYNESSIIIATSSSLIPPATTFSPDLPELFGVPIPSTPPATPSHPPWENFGPEQAIHLCEVKITAHNFIMGVSTKPLPPLFPQVTTSSRLTDMVIVPHFTVKASSSPGASVIDTSAPSVKEENNTSLHIVLAYLDLEDYLSPKSDLVCFELKRSKGTATESSKIVTWSHRHLQTRTFTNSAVSFLLWSRIPGSNSLLSGILELEGVAPRPSNDDGKPKEICIGKILRLKLPQLENDDDWEPSRLMAVANDVGTDPPISAAASPCESFICTSPATWSSAPKLRVHSQPRERNPTANSSISPLVQSLLSTLLSDRSSSDIVHVLANPTSPLSSVANTLELTLRTLESGEFSAQDWHFRIVGIVLDTFRARSKRLIDKETSADITEKAYLDDRWPVALDVCSVRAVRSAFDACKANDGYDMDPVWHLIALSSWLVDFTERLVRICVQWEGGLAVYNAHNSKEAPRDTEDVKVKMEAMEIDRDDLFDGELSPAPDASVYAALPFLTHISHPYALDNLIGAITHLNTFRAFLETLTASRLKTGIAKEVVVDVIDCSGINFPGLESALKEIKALEEFKTLDAETLQRCFCSLFPLPETHNLLVKACSLVTSRNAVSKPRLFIKPSDLVDGISKLNLATSKRNQERDIISKSVLGMPSAARVCARCNGKTETGQLSFPRGKHTSNFGGWAVWEHEWEKCICGGLWIKGAVH